MCVMSGEAGQSRAGAGAGAALSRIICKLLMAHRELISCLSVRIIQREKLIKRSVCGIFLMLNYVYTLLGEY